eukprot:6784593-Lingulodinium_polyedra.AAC.1
MTRLPARTSRRSSCPRRATGRPSRLIWWPPGALFGRGAASTLWALSLPLGVARARSLGKGFLRRSCSTGQLGS